MKSTWLGFLLVLGCFGAGCIEAAPNAGGNNVRVNNTNTNNFNNTNNTNNTNLNGEPGPSIRIASPAPMELVPGVFQVVLDSEDGITDLQILVGSESIPCPDAACEITATGPDGTLVLTATGSMDGQMITSPSITVTLDATPPQCIQPQNRWTGEPMVISFSEPVSFGDEEVFVYSEDIPLAAEIAIVGQEVSIILVELPPVPAIIQVNADGLTDLAGNPMDPPCQFQIPRYATETFELPPNFVMLDMKYDGYRPVLVLHNILSNSIAIVTRPFMGQPLETIATKVIDGNFVQLKMFGPKRFGMETSEGIEIFKESNGITSDTAPVWLPPNTGRFLGTDLGEMYAAIDADGDLTTHQFQGTTWQPASFDLSTDNVVGFTASGDYFFVIGATGLVRAIGPVGATFNLVGPFTTSSLFAAADGNTVVGTRFMQRTLSFSETSGLPIPSLTSNSPPVALAYDDQQSLHVSTSTVAFVLSNQGWGALPAPGDFTRVPAYGSLAIFGQTDNLVEIHHPNFVAILP